ncbi:acetylglutamate kinase [Clostridium celatum]|mgnify:CR=1 FL=1|uniref:acetylglutamate kinase n=1 Tax=Clostridium celatum TaxID=36834 RepID=UPI00189BB5A4|nr:acetylglutamate kinase [Clostridium celatum]MCE9654046.1 acetylglutamate kinase [Clostridium celatum]MDY3362359.1 acetylglutamate kinase [Clostridium celatum]
MNYTQHANVLVQALPYIQEYYGKTIVIKYGGNAMINDELTKTVINDIILMKCIGINPIIVHGGGPDITNTLAKMNYKSKFINGLRYTDETTISVAQMVLAGKVNKDLVKLIEINGGKALGLSGIDGSLIKAKKLEKDVDLGYVGEITSVNTDLLKIAMDSGYIPVISSIAIGESDSNSYNINADTCASKIAASLKAEKLILLTDVPGVMTDPSDPSTLISTLRLHQIPKLTVDKIIKGGMIPKINCCVESVRLGVKKAHIIDGRTPHSILLELLSEKGIGTEIY